MARFVEEIIEDKLVVSRKKKAVLVQELRSRKYRAFPKGDNAKKAKNTDEEMDQEEAENDEDADVDISVPGATDYDYLLSVSSQSMPLRNNATLLTFLVRCKSRLSLMSVLSG